MTGEEMLQEIERREYYARKEQKNAELVGCMVIAFEVGVIVWCVISIVGHVRELLAVL